jgi:hypothetical protein
MYVLNVDDDDGVINTVLRNLHNRAGNLNPPTRIPVDEDDFGDFASVNVAQLEDVWAIS